MLANERICLLILTTSCGCAPAAPPPAHEATVEAAPAPAALLPDEPPEPQPAVAPDSPLRGTWGCRGPIQHIARFYTVTLDLRGAGRFDLTYRDVSPEGGRVVMMEGTWRLETAGDASVLHARADTGSETEWMGDMHRHQHRGDGPPYATAPRRQRVSTHEREWPVLAASSDGPQIRLDAELGTRLGRALTTSDPPIFPRCDPGRFNDRDVLDANRDPFR